MQLTFLSADIPLVKSFSLSAGELIKTPYPMVRDFTSYTVESRSIDDTHQALVQAADDGHCLLKGALAHPITNASRAGLTSATDPTSLLVLDFDGFTDFETIDNVLGKLGLGGYSYILQPSASSILPGRTGELNAHIFMQFASPVPPGLLKTWIMNLCLTLFPTRVTLTKAGAGLHWPIDPSVCDNSKIIYIAPPVLGGDLEDLAFPPITLVKRKHDLLPASLVSVDVQKVESGKDDLLAKLRKAAGYKPLNAASYKSVGGVSYLAKPGRAVVTSKRVQRGFVYLNLNGGDSWGYWHPEDAFEFIYNFKGEPVYKTSELLPDYYAALQVEQAAPSAGKTSYFVCRDFRSDRLYNGVYDAANNELIIARAANEGRLRSFMKQHGQPVPDFIQDWAFIYDPANPTRWDAKSRVINFYKPSGLRQSWVKKGTTEIPPTIRRVLEHAVGKGPILDHFINYIATIGQHNAKLLVAWVLHGGQGTGKGLTIQLLRMIFGDTNVFQTTMGPLLGQFNGFLETSQIVAVDEAQLSATREVNFNAALLRSYITERSIPIRHMFSEPYVVPNFANFIFCSNMPDPVSVPQDDRRYNVGDYQPARLVISTDEIRQFYAEAPAFYDYLMCYSADMDRANSVLHTEARAHLQHLSRTAAGEMAQTILDGDFEDLWLNRPEHAMTPAETGYNQLLDQLSREGRKRHVLTRDELLTLFRYRVGDVPESPNRFTSYLKHNRIYTQRVRKGDAVHYGIYVDWKQEQEWFDAIVRSQPQKTSVMKLVAGKPQD